MTVRAPNVHPLTGLPDPGSTYTRSAPRDGLQNEDTIVPTATKAEFICPAGGRRSHDGRSHQLRVSQVGAPARRRRGAVPGLLERSPASGTRCWFPIWPGWSGPGRPASADIAVFAAATESFSRRNLNRTIDESLEMFAPVVAARPPGGHVGAEPTCPCASATPGKVTSPIGQVVDVADSAGGHGLRAS